MNATITIPIELANKIAERAAARGLSLEEYAREALERDIELSTPAESFEPVSEQPGAINGEIKDGIETGCAPMIDASKELRWLKEHRHEYMGQWIALDGDRLVAHGTNAREIFQTAREAGIKVPFVEQILPSDDLPFGGWMQQMKLGLVDYEGSLYVSKYGGETGSV